MLDLKEERRYNRLRKLAQELHIPMPEAFITLEVFDKAGKLIQRHHQRSHSWTRNAYNGLFSVMASKDLDDAAVFEAGKLSMKDTSADIQSGDNPLGYYTYTLDGMAYGYRSGAGEDTWGILVGSGENAESFENYVLQTQIVDGTGANELSHAESEAHAISHADTTLTNTLIRYFNNNTVGETSVDVNEVAIVTKAYFPGTNKMFLMTRDKLVSTVTVPSTGQLKVTYTIQLAYPS